MRTRDEYVDCVARTITSGCGVIAEAIAFPVNLSGKWTGDVMEYQKGFYRKYLSSVAGAIEITEIIILKKYGTLSEAYITVNFQFSGKSDFIPEDPNPGLASGRFERIRLVTTELQLVFKGTKVTGGMGEET